MNSSNSFVVRESTNSTGRPRVKVKSSRPVSLEEARDFVRTFVKQEEAILLSEQLEFSNAIHDATDVGAQEDDENDIDRQEFLQIESAKRKIHESEPDIDTEYLDKLKIFCGLTKSSDAQRKEDKQVVIKSEKETATIIVKQEYNGDEDIVNRGNQQEVESERKEKRKRESIETATEEKKDKKLKKVKKEKKEKKEKKDKKKKKHKKKDK